MIVPQFVPVMRGGGDIERKTVEFEDNVKKSFANVAGQALPKLAPTNLKTAAYTAMLDELVVCNGTFNVTLPVASSKNGGRQVGVIVRAGTITVITASGLVQGAASDALGTAGMYAYTSDGIAGWWRR